jgi:hypothetical protein
MRAGKSLWTGLILGAMLLAAPAARADMVTFITTGTFSGGDAPGTSTYLNAALGIDIVFNGSLNNTVTVPPASLASFGTFDTSATTTTTFAPVTTDFTLNIIQTAPVAGTGQFTGTISGTLMVTNSQVFLLFSGPLSETIGGSLYTILNADSSVPGRVNIAPPSTNLGITTINGQVNRAVPEPGTLSLLLLGGPAILLYRMRRKVTVQT